MISRDWFEGVPMHRTLSLKGKTLPVWIGRGLSTFGSKARLLDIGTPESYASAQSFFATGVRQ